MSAPLLENCRDASVTSERRHIRKIGETAALCGTKERQLGAGAGTHAAILRWATCRRCKQIAQDLGPHPAQASTTGWEQWASRSAAVERLKQ